MKIKIIELEVTCGSSKRRVRPVKGADVNAPCRGCFFYGTPECFDCAPLIDDDEHFEEVKK